jgi:hypothetical protein
MTSTNKKVWKIPFFKNVTKEGGAMKDAISACNNNEVVIHSQTVKNGRMWGHTEPIILANLIEKNYGIYEVITNFPHKLYFDIDGDTSCNLQVVKEIINQFFPNADIAVSGSITEKKISYHIICDNYTIHDEEERIYIKTIVKHICTTINDSFDWKVYTKNRNMKCINQSKDDGRVQQIIENDDYKKHLITCFINPYSIPFIQNMTDDIKEIVAIEKSKSVFNLGSLPKLKLEEPSNVDMLTITPEEVLKMLPCNKSFNHDYTHLIARYCFHNAVSLTMFLSWIANKNNDKSYFNKWTIHWNNLHKFPPVTTKRIEAILSHYYPNILKDKHYKKFINAFNFKTSPTKIESINPTHFDNSNKFLIFNTGMGSGKTTQTIDYLKQNNNFCWICPNKSLANNTLFRLTKENISANDYLKFSAKDKKTGILNTLDNLVLVVNSMHYVQNPNFKVVVIDEIETVLDKFHGDFMKSKKETWIAFMNIIKRADKVILLDAFITNKTLNFLKNIDAQQPIIYERLIEPTMRTVNYIKSAGDKSVDTTVSEIIGKLKDNKKLFIYYPYKKNTDRYMSMEQLNKMLIIASGKTGIYYNADIDDDVKVGLKDVNKSWSEISYVITNNIITCGVNYDKPSDFDEAYIFIASFSCPRDIIQVSYRVRDLISRSINVCFMGKMTQPNAFICDNHIISCPIYTNLITDILNEKYSPIKNTFSLFCNKASYNQTVCRKIMDENLEKYLSDLRTESECGFKYLDIPNMLSDESERIQQKMFSQEATMLEKFQLQKYFFIHKFKPEGKEDDKLADFWDNDLSFFFGQMQHSIFDETNIFSKISKLNNWGNFFPDNAELKKIKLNSELLDEIFRTFTFKFITRTSQPIKILSDIYVVFFKNHLIDTIYDDNKHSTYSIDDYATVAAYNYGLEYLWRQSPSEPPTPTM